MSRDLMKPYLTSGRSHPPKAVVMIAAALLTASGCSVKSTYRSPDVTVPPDWQTPPAADAQTPAAPAGPWWNAFGNPELARLVEVALAGNYDLKGAVSRVQQARAQAQIAGAALYPSVAAGADVGVGNAKGQSGSSATATTPQLAANSTVDVNANFDLDVSGRNRRLRDAALARVGATEFAQQDLSLTTAAAVVTTYAQLLGLTDRLSIARESLAAADNVLELLTVRFNAGAVSGLEVAQQRTAVAQLRATVAALDQSHGQTSHALDVLLGQAPGARRSLSAPSLAVLQAPQIPPGLPSALLTRRPDIREAEAELRASSADIDAARAALLPTVRLTGQGGIASPELASLLTGGFYRLAAGLTAPLFDGGRLRGQVALESSRYDELVSRYHAVSLAALREVEDALVALNDLANQQAANQEAVTQAQEATRLIDLRFRAGAVDFLNVLESQRTLLNARDALAQTQLNRVQATVRLIEALGGSW